MPHLFFLLTHSLYLCTSRSCQSRDSERFNRVTVPKRRRKKGMSVFFLHSGALPSLFSTLVLICSIFCYLFSVTYPTSCRIKIKPAMKDTMQMENNSWRETAKNMRTSGVAKSKQLLLLFLSLSLKIMPKYL